ncbi:MAG: alpha/beta fold hydrolase [Alphaproteobacteria bacterium]|jgi:3-oxoadipate enol-lactonase|nr:alpha/beta fold hydrolase [Alphaproteobacteria bacterium]
MPICEVDGVALSYEIAGPQGRPEAAPALTFAHGYAFDRGCWRPQVAAFRDHHRVLSFDFRGHGESGLGAADYRMEDLAADVVGLLDANGIERTHYVGASLGGMVGFALALGHADRLASLTLMATQGVMPDSGKQFIRDNVKAMQAAGEVIGDRARVMTERYFAPEFKAENPAEFERLQGIVAGHSVAGFAKSSAAIVAMDFDDRLEEIHVPTLVVAGEFDVPTPPGRMEVYRDRIPGARMAVIAGAGHVPNAERPHAFNAVLADFFDQR